MNEKPLERLNYFNGQRLQAEDLRVEQDYHMRVRRWLNRSLYSAGIASGLQVHKVPNVPKVRIGPGLALDDFGREMILLDMVELVVPGTLDHENKPTEANKPVGLYLTLRYHELTTGQQDSTCSSRAGGMNRPAAGGPSRVLAEPVIEWSLDLPHEGSGRVLLAFVGLGKGCQEVSVLDLGVRRYVGAASAAKVRQYALEGVRDIDSRNVARVYFHIRGRQPSAITLYFRAEQLPTLYYTEVGHHDHISKVDVGTLRVPAHTHGVAGMSGKAGKHTPTVNRITARVDATAWSAVLIASGPVGATAAATAWVGNAINPDAGFMPLTVSPHLFWPNNQSDLFSKTTNKLVNMKVDLDPVEEHDHHITSFPDDGRDALFPLTGTATISPAGVDDTTEPFRARPGPPLKYVTDLQLAIDGENCTAKARRQIAANRPDEEDWSMFGKGTGGDERSNPLRFSGSGALRLDFLPEVVLGQGEHFIEFSVLGDGNGGRIHFNLYVE